MYGDRGSGLKDQNSVNRVVFDYEKPKLVSETVRPFIENQTRFRRNYRALGVTWLGSGHSSEMSIF